MKQLGRDDFEDAFLFAHAYKVALETTGETASRAYKIVCALLQVQDAGVVFVQKYKPGRPSISLSNGQTLDHDLGIADAALNALGMTRDCAPVEVVEAIGKLKQGTP